MTTPKILTIDLENNTEELRSLTLSESSDYSSAIQNSEAFIDKKQQALLKLQALGLTEEDIKAVMS
jgi:hypothetical protein